MGGNAIKDAKRITKLQYDLYCSVLDHILDNLGVSHSFVKFYTTKETFGDIDVLVLIPTTTSTGGWTQTLREVFQPNDEYHNGDVYSINYAGVQVDFIRVENDAAMKSADFYFGFNDMGNLIGRIAHAQGLKFGHDGLWFSVYAPDNDTLKLGEILLATDKDAILGYLGFSVENYGKFDTIEDIFEYVIAGTGFNKNLFPLEHRSHTARIRDRKRKTYTSFLKYLIERNPPDQCDYKIPKFVYQFMALDHFDKDNQYEALIERYGQDKVFHEKWNGALVSKITGLTGKSLGQFMRYIVGGDVEKFRNWVLSDLMFASYDADERIERWLHETHIIYNQCLLELEHLNHH